MLPATFTGLRTQGIASIPDAGAEGRAQPPWKLNSWSSEMSHQPEEVPGTSTWSLHNAIVLVKLMAMTSFQLKDLSGKD